MKYVMGELQSIFPKEIINNIFLICTFCELKSSVLLDYRELNIKEENVYAIDNPYAMEKIINKTKYQRDIEKLYKKQKMAFENCNDEIIYLFENAFKLTPCATNSFIEIYEQKSKLELRLIDIANKKIDF